MPNLRIFYFLTAEKLFETPLAPIAQSHSLQAIRYKSGRAHPISYQLASEATSLGLLASIPGRKSFNL